MSDLPEIAGSENGNGKVVILKGMYDDYFMDYASYVILERAVPDVDDGLKPVQRRILHAMKQMDDGRYHKVANIIGQTMQYHPHGDAAIGDALVNLGQKDLLIDCQGNWGDSRTGDSAAAPRYIEARLTKFALEVLFNAKTTEWQYSYDGRKKEPIALPAKFPLLLSQGVEGIAVGLSTKIMPHNFNELIHASIDILKGKEPKIYPDFQTGGIIDVSDYNGGKRGGRIKIRSSIEQVDKKTLAIRDLPYGVTTGYLIDSIIKANDKGKIRIKKVVDNTAKDVEILIHLHAGVSPELTMDALFATTNCEVSISPNACVIVDNKPQFLTVNEILKISTLQTKDLLKLELQIEEQELLEKWHFSSLVKIFIEQRVYREIEECETWEAVIDTIHRELKKYVSYPGNPQAKNELLRLHRNISEDDIVRLTEIKIKRISKYNSFKADEYIKSLEEELTRVRQHLDQLVQYTIDYFLNLLNKYGKGKERKTAIKNLESIEVAAVVANNAKLYIDRKEGFIGYGLKKDEYIMDCSDIDDIIVFLKNGSFQVVRISDKVFVGKNIIHAAVWKRGDDRTTYNMMYLDGKTGRTMAKRFHVSAIIREKLYDLTKGNKNSRVLYFSANPNGESEIVQVILSPSCKAKKKAFEFSFEDLSIKGRSAGGNIVSKYPVKKANFVSRGKSTLGAQKFWMDDVSGRLNKEERGTFIGEYDTGDTIFCLYKDGTYEVKQLVEHLKFEPKDLLHIYKFNPATIISAVYYEGSKKWTMVKRFVIETSSNDLKFSYISDHSKSKLLFVSLHPNPKISFAYQSNQGKVTDEVNLSEFIDVKGWKALGNRLHGGSISNIKDISPEISKKAELILAEQISELEQKKEDLPKKISSKSNPQNSKAEEAPKDGIKPGDTIDFDLDNQGTLFD